MDNDTSTPGSDRTETCDVCGGQIDPASETVYELDLDRAFIRALLKVDKPVAAEVRAAEGSLVRHEDCEHPVEEYMPEPREPEVRTDGGADPTDRYRGTDDRDGVCLLACVECDETWPEGRFEDGRCPDCREGGRL